MELAYLNNYGDLKFVPNVLEMGRCERCRVMFKLSGVSSDSLARPYR